jgi:hypothetical protein
VFLPIDGGYDHGYYAKVKATTERTNEIIETRGMIWCEDGDDVSLRGDPEVFSQQTVKTLCVYVTILGSPPKLETGKKHRGRCDTTEAQLSNFDHKKCCAYSDAGMGKRNWFVSCSGEFMLWFAAAATTGSRSGLIQFSARTPTNKNLNVSLLMTDDRVVQSVGTRGLDWSVGQTLESGVSTGLDLSTGGEHGDAAGANLGVTRNNGVSASLNRTERVETKVSPNKGTTLGFTWRFDDSRVFDTDCHVNREKTMIQGGRGLFLLNATALVPGVGDSGGEKIERLLRVDFEANMKLTILKIDSQAFQVCSIGKKSFGNRPRFERDQKLESHVTKKDMKSFTTPSNSSSSK